MGGSATPEQIQGMLKEIKPEERKWLGIDDFLKGKEKVSKEALLEFLRGNAVEIKEVVKSDSKAVTDLPEGVTVKSNSSGTVFNIFSPEGRLLGRGGSEEEARQDALSTLTSDETHPATFPKFSQYTLPGGENYREVLFQLPPAEAAAFDPINGWDHRELRTGSELWTRDVNGVSAKIRHDNDGTYKLQAYGTNFAHNGEFPSFEAAAKELVSRVSDIATAKMEGNYKSSHFDEPNVLAHTRLNDRVDSAGKKVLFVEEIQSDWHQAGRKKGYKEGPTAHEVAKKELFEYKAMLDDKYDGRPATNASPEEKAKWNELSDRYKASFDDEKFDAVPDAPFKKTWHEFVLKRLIREAAEKGYDKIAWTTGEQQADRYDLAKQVDEVKAKKNKDGTYAIKVFKDGDSIHDVSSVQEKDLEAQLGKDLSAKIIADGSSRSKSYKGVDLKVGGEGMKGFYDKILPEFANKFGKKYGAKVSESSVEIGKSGFADRVYEGPELSPEKIREVARKSDARVEMQLRGLAQDIEAGATFKEAAPKNLSVAAAEALGGSLNEKPGVNSEKVHSLEITPALKEAALKEGFSLFQGDENNPRGEIKINGREFKVDLFKEKDKSTFFHETGHFFLEVLGHVVEGEGKGSESLKQDYAAILKFLGVHERTEIEDVHHEKFARAFEQYLSTGEAPSLPLRDAFARFRQWLTKLWKKVAFQRVEISPEIKEVFDRLLATDDQINEVKRSLNMSEEFDFPELDGETKERIKSLQEKARIQVEEQLLKERLPETKADYKEKLDAESRRLRGEIEQQIKQEPLFAAIEGLRETGEKVDPYALADKALRGELTPEESVHFEMISDEHGFPTAEELARQISEAGSEDQFNSRVKAAVNEELIRSGQVKDSAALREEALRAIHAEHMTELLALEREALVQLAENASVKDETRRRNRVIARAEAQAANEQAAKIIAEKPVKEAGRPGPYITMERNAAARAAKFIAKKDFEKAAQAKKEQMIAHALVRESFRANDEAAKHMNYLEKYMNRGASMLDMPFGFVRQVDQLLSRFGFQDQRGEDAKTLIKVAQKMASDGESSADIANATGYIESATGAFVPETFADFMARVNDNYYGLSVPDSILSFSSRESGEMTLSELKDLREAVQAIGETGKKYNRFLSEFLKVDVKEAAMKFRSSVEENFGAKYSEDMLPGSKEQGKVAELLTDLSRLPDALERTLDTILTTCHKFDGLEEGPAKEFIYRPIAEAQAQKITRTRVAMEEMEKIFAKNYDLKEFAKYKDTKIVIDGRAFTKEEILAMALNWGNDGNRDRLMRGFGFDEAKMKRIFSNLGANDWNFAQDTWNHIDKYWPEIARLEMDINGVEPGKVRAKKFVNEHGSFEGGYYPIAYDFEKSADAFQNNQSKDALFKQYSTAKAATEQGHAAARVVRVTRPLRLSLDVLTSHHEDVIHDLEFRRAVIDINRFLSQKDTKTAITNAVGVRGYASFQDWLKSVAGGGSEPMTFWDKAAQWFRFKTTFFNLGYRIVSAPKIAIENVVNVSSEIGISGTARALKNYYLGDSGMHELVVEKSAYMRQRAEHLNRDMSDIVDKYRDSEISGFKKYAFFVHAYLDQGMSFPLWADTFRRGMADHGDEKLAVNQANESVKRTFMSGGSADQPAVMRGNEKQKALTTAYGYQSMMWNRFSQQRFQAGMEWAAGNHLAATAIAARATVYTFLMPALVTALTRELIRNSKGKNDEDQKKRVTESLLEEMSPLKFVPLARDIQSYAIRKGMGERASSLQVTPLEEAVQTLIDPVGEIISGKHSKNLPEKSANALSLMIGVPKQINDATFNFIDWQQNNGELTWRDALSRRHKK
jgi:hypothetical protein